MSASEIEKLSSKEVQDYILEHETNDVHTLLLRNKTVLGLPVGLVADQLIARKKISVKVPLFHKIHGVIYPPSPNLEQCSSEATAKFKAQLLLKELHYASFQFIADLTGGFGIDSYFLSQEAEHLDFVEPNKSLTELAHHNFNILGISNLHVHCTGAEDFLKESSQKFDFVFLDPSRRDSHSKKVFQLADCQPNIPNLLPLLFDRTEFVLIKASPLLDIHQGLRELVNVKKVVVVSVGNECKELLFLLQKGFEGEALVEACNLNTRGKVSQVFSFTFKEEKNCIAAFGELQTYLYEPNVSILKSGAFKLIGENFNLNKLHPNTHLYTSSSVKMDFPGRVFKIEQPTFDPKSIPGGKANVITRNYPLKAEELKKKLKLEDGGENYVIAFSGTRKKHIVLATRLG